MKKKEVLDAKEEKLNVKQLLSNELQLLSSQNVDPEDPVYKEKINKSGGQLNIYNKILKDAKTVIKSKEAALKEIDDIGFDLDDRKLDVSAMNRDSLLKELDIQSKKLTYAENQRKKRESILKEIEMKNNEVSHAKKEKLKVKHLLSNLSSNNVDSDDPVYKQQVISALQNTVVYYGLQKQ